MAATSPSGWQTSPVASYPASAIDGGNRWIVADIGGTNARLGLWDPDGGVTMAHRQHYRNDDFPDLAALLQAYRSGIGQNIQHALLAVAVPLAQADLRMTNRTWRFSPESLRASTGLTRLLLVNDFGAAAAGIPGLTPDEQERIGGGEPGDGPRLVLGPGTGLGAAMLLAGTRHPEVISSEAGHMGAAPTQALASKVLRRLQRQFGRVSWERLLCGSGLAMFDAVEGDASEPASAAEVARRLQEGDATAQTAARAYAYALGEFAGDLCLAVRATGGIWLTGGVLAGLGDAFDAAAFRAGLENKGRMADLLAATPVFRVIAEDLALRGLTHLLSGRVNVPVVEARRKSIDPPDTRA